MRTTIDIPDELFRTAKATAALRGESLRELVTAALRSHLERHESGTSTVSGWRRAFGRAQPEEVAEVDAALSDELEAVDPEGWR